MDGTDVADMDGDGDNDFLSCEGNTGEVFLYTNNGGGSFTPILVASGVTSTFFCTNLRIADFNNDGMNDFVVGDNQNFLGTKVYVQGPVGTFSVSATLDTSWTDTGNNLFGVAAGDLNGDGNADILMLGYFGLGAGQVRFYAGDGAGNFATSTLLFNVDNDFGVSGGNGLAMFDLEGDGDLDIVVGGGLFGPAGGGEHFIYTNSGSGNVTAPSTFTFQIDNAQTGVDAFDADGDGDHDLVVAAFGPATLSYVQNLGGTLAAPVVVASLDGNSIGVGAPPLQRKIQVAIDIKPASFPNSINPQSEGVIPVAILTTPAFDATTVDPLSVRFGPNRATEAHRRGHIEDVDGDGDNDMVLHFRTQATGIQCGDTSASLIGKTTDGKDIKGSDSIKTVGCKKEKK